MHIHESMIKICRKPDDECMKDYWWSISKVQFTLFLLIIFVVLGLLFTVFSIVFGLDSMLIQNQIGIETNWFCDPKFWSCFKLLRKTRQIVLLLLTTSSCRLTSCNTNNKISSLHNCEKKNSSLILTLITILIRLKVDI